jgi:hypothetical protein
MIRANTPETAVQSSPDIQRRNLRPSSSVARRWASFVGMAIPRNRESRPSPSARPAFHDARGGRTANRTRLQAQDKGPHQRLSTREIRIFLKIAQGASSAQLRNELFMR